MLAEPVLRSHPPCAARNSIELSSTFKRIPRSKTWLKTPSIGSGPVQLGTRIEPARLKLTTFVCHRTRSTRSERKAAGPRKGSVARRYADAVSRPGIGETGPDILHRQQNQAECAVWAVIRYNIEIVPGHQSPSVCPVVTP